jgi:hypothetical protein
MGFSGWPPDMEMKAIEKAYELSNQNSDIRLVQFDGGVPWVEMSQNQLLPARIQSDWEYIKSKCAGKKIFVATTPLDFDRTGLALYANEKDDNQPLPDDWKNLAFNNDKVKQAYLTYAETVIKFWQPDYLAISIEANILAATDQEKWNQYLELHRYIYTELKKQYPRVEIFATIQMENFKGLTDVAIGKAAVQKQAVGDLLKYCDIAALSVYPYQVADGKLTADYFDDIKAFNKPLAISETGWPSEKFKISGVTHEGSDQAQCEYLQNLLRAASENQFVFVINWVNIDYTKLLAKLPAGPGKEFANAWVYDGLWNENFNEKPALEVWQSYLRLTHR